MEKSKIRQGSDEYLMNMADETIGKLVVEKEHLFKAYNYYQGFRDRYQYQHLEDNYGVGNPTSIKFTPLVRKHVDAIVGEFLTKKIKPLITCKDSKTLTNIMRDKQLEIAKRNTDYVKKFLTNAVYDAIMGKGEVDQKQQDIIVTKELKDIQDSVSREFIPTYEIAAQCVIKHVLESRAIDYKNKVMQLMLDLLIGGEMYYEVIPTSSNNDFQIEVEDPLNTFVFRKHNSRYLKDGTKSVIRRWLTREEIAIKYGKDLSKEDLNNLQDIPADHYTQGNLAWIAAMNYRGCPRTPGILAGDEVTTLPTDIYDVPYELIPVYEVEWIDYDKSKDKGVLYKVTRIGGDIYILDGEQDPIRSMSTEKEPRLTINGLLYTNRGIPYSLMLATAQLQDVYDLLLYQKDNLIALSGTKGANVDVAHLPEFLGESMKERVMKYQAYRKLGLAFFDSAQEGEPLNTIFNGYDDTVSYNAIQAIQLAIQMIEDTVSSITGVFRERLGGIQERDAVANVEVGMKQSYIITKQYHQAMETLISEMLTDALNVAKKVYKKGHVGEVVLGNYKDIFTVLPENFSFTDYDIHLADANELEKEQETIKQYALEYTKSQQIDPLDMVTIATSNSLTEMRDLMYKSAERKKKENDQFAELTKQYEQAQQQIKDLTKQLDASTKKLQQLDEKKLAIEQQDNQMRQNIEWFKAKADAEYKEKQLDLIKQRNKLEAAQLFDDNKRNDEVRNDLI